MICLWCITEAFILEKAQGATDYNSEANFSLVSHGLAAHERKKCLGFHRPLILILLTLCSRKTMGWIKWAWCDFLHLLQNVFIMPSASTRKDLEMIKLSEGSWTEKDK